jgi:hypothetical protein
MRPYGKLLRKRFFRLQSRALMRLLVIASYSIVVLNLCKTNAFLAQAWGGFSAGAQLPFYVRKSVSAGPFRFNFSKSGVGVSVGVKGLRIGTGPRGHYIHAGRGGLYYRATLGSTGGSRKPSASPQQRALPKVTFDNSDVEMLEINSGDVMHMRDTSFSELLDEINSKALQTRMSVALSLTALAIGAVMGLATGGPGLLICAVALPAGAIGSWLDSYRRTTVLYYDLEGDAETAYGRLTEGYDGLKSSAAKWHIEAGGAIQSLAAWKRNAGASHLVNRKSTALAYALPAVIKSNVTPPALRVGRQVMFFMPDIVLVQDGSRVGAVTYADLKVRWQDSRFIETERVPSDAKIVDHTWQHPNKSGGPDRRFEDNRQIPICLYETMHLTSNSGVNELIEFSRTGVVAAFVDGCRMLAALPQERKPTVALPPTPANDSGEVAPINATPRTGSVLKGALLTILGLLVGIPAFSIFYSPHDTAADAGLPPNLVAEISETIAIAQKVADLPKDTEQRTSQVTTVAETKPVQLGPITNDKAEPETIRHAKTDANLREGPGTKFTVIIVVPKGGQVSVLETKSG